MMMMTRDPRYWLLVTIAITCVSYVAGKPAVENIISDNSEDTPTYVDTSAIESDLEDSPEITIENEGVTNGNETEVLVNETVNESTNRRPISTNPEHENIGNGNEAMEGMFFDTADWVKEAEQWTFKGGDWGLITLPDDDHPDIPTPPVPGPVLLAEGNSMGKVIVTRSETNVENLTLHFSYFLSNNPTNPPVLEVYQIKDSTHSERVSVETTYGEWTTSTLALPYSGDFEIKFIGQRIVDKNKIALDDIVLRGYYMDNDAADPDISLGDAEEGNDGDAEVDSDEDDGDTEQYSDLDDGDAEEDNTIDDGDAEEDNNVDYGDSEEDNDVDDGVAEEDNYVDDGDSDEDNYVDDGDAEEDNYVDDGGGDEDSEEEDQYDEVDDEDYSGDDYNGYYSSGDLYDQDYYNDWFNNLIDSDDVASGDQDDTTEDPNIILYSKDTIEANETFGDTGDGGAFIIFSTSCVIMACLLGFLYWRRRRLEDDEIPIFSRGANDDYSVPEYQDEPNEDDRLTAKQQNYKSYN